MKAKTWAFSEHSGLFLREILVPKAKSPIENLALWQQLPVCQRRVKRPRLRLRDRTFWALGFKPVSSPGCTFTALLEIIGGAPSGCSIQVPHLAAMNGVRRWHSVKGQSVHDLVNPQAQGGAERWQAALVGE